MSYEQICSGLSWLVDRSLGSFLGVGAAFALNYTYQRFKDRHTKSEYLKAFRNEVKDSIASLERRGLELLRMDNWTSAVNSGDLKLFSSKQRDLLSRIYAGNSNFNYEAKRTRDMNEEFNRTIDPMLKQQVHAAWQVATQRAFTIGDSALRALRVLAKEEWFKEKDA